MLRTPVSLNESNKRLQPCQLQVSNSNYRMILCSVIKVLGVKHKLINYLNNITMQFIKSERRFLKNTSTIPTYFLSDKIKSYIKEDLNFMPENVYVSNAAGDYVFISVVKDNDVYTLTDSFYLEAQMKDFGIKPN